ncbi:MAG: hypothetical protein J4G10_02505 [Alphaproteobacteria bacterium]|nr:hypothetical protein [Alphaproteobacteria bacterium]
MNVSRNRRAAGFSILAAITFGVAFAVSLPPPAWAEGPIPLAPTPDSGTRASGPEEKAETVGLEDDAMEGEAETSGDSPMVDVVPLEQVDPNSVGLLDSEAGGFGIAMWQGTDRALLERLLPKLPATPRSPVMRSLQRRLLLSTATAPGDSPLQVNLLPLRFERLAAMGESQAIVELARIVPAHAMDESMAIAYIENAFLAGETETGCQEVRGRIRDYQGAHWQRMLVFCEVLAKEAQAVQLGLALLHEMPEQTSPAFFHLVDAILDKDGAEVFNLPDPSPLEAVMIGKTNRQVPPDAGTATHPAVLRALAMNPNAPVLLRLDAGERAETIGTLSADELGELYRGVPFRSEEVRDVDNAALGEAKGRALLYRAAREQTDPSVRAELLQRLWRETRAMDPAGTLYATAVRVNLPTLLAIAPKPELAWFAAEAGKALLLAEQTPEAFAWLAIVQQAAYENANAEATRNALWPFVKLADGGGNLAWEAERLTAWWKAHGGAPEKEDPALLFALLAALGEPVGESEWTELLNGAPFRQTVVPALAIRHGLAAAAAAGRVGETVLLALLSLGAGGPGEASPVTLEAVIAALKQIGLEEEARGLAVEASLMKGL